MEMKMIKSNACILHNIMYNITSSCILSHLPPGCEYMLIRLSMIFQLFLHLENKKMCNMSKKRRYYVTPKQGF